MNGTSAATVKDAPTVVVKQAMTCETAPTSNAFFSRTVAEIGTLGAAEVSRKMADAVLAVTVPICTTSWWLCH